jgi:hypothetical protein
MSLVLLKILALLNGELCLLGLFQKPNFLTASLCTGKKECRATQSSRAGLDSHVYSYVFILFVR